MGTQLELAGFLCLRALLRLFALCVLKLLLGTQMLKMEEFPSTMKWPSSLLLFFALKSALVDSPTPAPFDCI